MVFCGLPRFVYFIETKEDSFPPGTSPQPGMVGGKATAAPTGTLPAQAHFDTRCSSVRGEQDHVSPWP